MSKTGKSSRSREPRPSKALQRLRDAIGLDPAGWQAFLGHARNGFADYERAHWSKYDEPLDLPDVPKEWFGDPESLGYVVIRVLREADADLAIPVAQFFLHICEPAADHVMEPPGMGLAWLYLRQHGLACPVEPARLAYVAMQIPGPFFQGVAEEDLLALGRLVLEAKGAPGAWDLQALVAAVEHAQIHAHAPFRLFDGLMSADWIPREVKREFCRGLLGCSPEEDRLREQSAAINDLIEADSAQMDHIPRMELAHIELRRKMPGLRRHAVLALVEGVGESALNAIREFLLRCASILEN
jgi:hypothetical protein